MPQARLSIYMTCSRHMNAVSCLLLRTTIRHLLPLTMCELSIDLVNCAIRYRLSTFSLNIALAYHQRAVLSNFRLVDRRCSSYTRYSVQRSLFSWQMLPAQQREITDERISQANMWYALVRSDCKPRCLARAEKGCSGNPTSENQRLYSGSTSLAGIVRRGYAHVGMSSKYMTGRLLTSSCKPYGSRAEMRAVSIGHFSRAFNKHRIPMLGRRPPERSSQLSDVHQSGS